MAKVYVSDIINLPVDKVWAYARDYNGHYQWHPRIKDSVIEGGGPSDQVGCVRSFHVDDGGHLRERLLSFSDVERSFTYNIIVSPMPIENYVATFRCIAVTEGNKTLVEWSATFDVPAAEEARIKDVVGRQTFAAGIKALAKKLGAPA